ncbi:MAG: hypothetical protein ACK4TP_15125 [Hyphomicrobium sp.]|jgi:hypothetical protein
MRCVLLTLMLTASSAARAEGYIRSLEEATPAAAELMTGKAHDWRRAPEIVKDRTGLMIFERNFPYKGDMNPDDMIACIDELALKSDSRRPVDTMIAECGGVPGYVEAD